MDDYKSSEPSDEPGGQNRSRQKRGSKFFSKEKVEILNTDDFEEPDYETVTDEDELEDTPEWDGSEAEFVEDKDAYEYEDEYSGIKLSYKLKKEEIYDCLKRAGYNRKSTKRDIVKTILMSFVSLISFILFFRDFNILNLVLGFMSLAVIFVIWFIPYYMMMGRAKSQASGQKIDVEIYPDEVVVTNNLKKWVIPLDSTSEFDEFEDMMVLFTPDSKMLGIPIRCIEPSVIADVQAMLIAGTKPHRGN